MLLSGALAGCVASEDSDAFSKVDPEGALDSGSSVPPPEWDPEYEFLHPWFVGASDAARYSSWARRNTFGFLYVPPSAHELLVNDWMAAALISMEAHIKAELPCIYENVYLPNVTVTSDNTAYCLSEHESERVQCARSVASHDYLGCISHYAEGGKGTGAQCVSLAQVAYGEDFAHRGHGSISEDGLKSAAEQQCLSPRVPESSSASADMPSLRK